MTSLVIKAHCASLLIQTAMTVPLCACSKKVKKKKVKVKVTQLCLTLCDPMDYTYWNSPWNPPGQNPGVGSLSLLQGLFPTQGPTLTPNTLFLISPMITFCGC